MYNHKLVNDLRATCKKLTKEENIILYEQVLTGDKDAIEQLITGNLALVIYKINRFLKFNPQHSYLREDLISQGFMAVIEAVNKLAQNKEVKKINPTGYISWSIHNSTINYLKTQNFTNLIESEADPTNVPTEVCFYDDLHDLLLSYCDTDFEKQILNLRSIGQNFKTIAIRTGKSTITIRRAWKKLLVKLTQKTQNF